MEKRIELDRIPRSLRMKKLGSGVNGTCYLTSDGRVYKQYHYHGIDDKITEMLLDLDYMGFYFPEQMVILKDQFKGILRKHARGLSLDKVNFSEVSIIDFIAALKDFEDKLINFSYDTGLFLYEINPGALVYNTDLNRLVDVDTDTVCPFDYSYVNPCYENMKELSNGLCHMFMEGDFQSKRLRQFQKESLIGGYVRPSVFMSEALDKLDDLADINTVDDYQRGLVLLRK